MKPEHSQPNNDVYTNTNTQSPNPTTSSKPCNEATIETLKRPRGRPPGSKNKPKPPLVLTHDPCPTMTPHIFQVPTGQDIIHAISSYSLNNHTNLCILSASGTVSNVTLKQQLPCSSIKFIGCFDILSISGTVTSSSSCAGNGFSVSLAGPQGQVVGGVVDGGLVAAGTVHVVAASFNDPVFHRLPLEEDLGVLGDGTQLY